MTNPFAAPTIVPTGRQVYGDASLVRSFFLFRVIEMRSPIKARLVYSGWWFRQKLELDGQLVWFRISWLTIFRRAEFRLPASIDPAQSPAELEITFGRTLFIRRFRLWINGELVYDEVR